MKKLFYCEKCNATFDSEKECMEHEEYCQKSLPVKCILIDNYFWEDNDKININIMEYSTAVLVGKDKIKLVATSYHFLPFKIDLLHLDKIYEFKENIGIFTTNFNEKYEKECIEKLIQKRKEVLKKRLEDYIKETEDKLKKLDTKESEIFRDKNCRQIISDFEDFIS